MTFDFSRLRRGEWIAGIAAIALFVVMFLNWFEPNGLVDLGWNAWEAFSVIDVILLLTIVAMLALVLLTASQPTDALPVTAAVIATTLALLSTLLVAFRVLIDQPGFGLGVPDDLVDNTLWAYVGLLLCVALVYGGYRSMRDERSPLDTDRPIEARRVRPPAPPSAPPPAS